MRILYDDILSSFPHEGEGNEEKISMLLHDLPEIGLGDPDRPQKICGIVAKQKEKRLTEKEYANLQKRYRNILTRGNKELPSIPPKPKGKRSKMAKSEVHNLLERPQQYETGVLLFAKDPNVPFTNNRAERDLRMAKVIRKYQVVSGKRSRLGPAAGF